MSVVSIMMTTQLMATLPFQLPSFAKNEKKNAEAQKEYSRKSISSPDSLLFFLNSGKHLDGIEAKHELDTYIELKRFDHNSVPSVITKKFIEEVTEVKVVTEEKIRDLVEDVYANEIKKILDNPQVQKARIDNFKEKKSFTFAYSKGRSYSVTADDLNQLFHSSFFYVPYISHSDYSITYYKKERKDKKIEKYKRIKYKLEGGILWYQLKFKSDNSVEVHFIAHHTEKVERKKDVEPSAKDRHEVDLLVTEAFHRWGSSLAHQLKFIDQFKLVGKLINSDKNSHEIGVYNTEDIGIDTPYWLMEDQEINGGVTSKKIGIAYINTVGHKTPSETIHSKATQIYGATNKLPSWVKEVPKLGVDVAAYFNINNNFRVDKRDAILDNQYLFNKAVDKSWGVAVLGSYNLAESLGKSQWWADLDGSFNFITPGLNNGSISYVTGAYLGVRRVHWVKQFGLQYFLRVGEHIVYVDEGGTLDYYQMEVFGIKAGVSLQKMITPFLLLDITAYQTMTLGEPRVHYQTELSSGAFKSDHSRLNWWGVSFGLKSMQ